MEDECNCWCLRKATNRWAKRKSWQAAADCGCLGGCSACEKVDPDDIGILSLICRLACCYVPVRLFTCLLMCIPDCCWFLWNGCHLCCTHIMAPAPVTPEPTITCCHMLSAMCDEEKISNSRNLGVSPINDYQGLFLYEYYDDSLA